MDRTEEAACSSLEHSLGMGLAKPGSSAGWDRESRGRGGGLGSQSCRKLFLRRQETRAEALGRSSGGAKKATWDVE